MKFRLNVDEEFKKIAPPISRSEYAELEKSIMSEGCRDPIIIWNGVIVDGHNRYVICRHHDIQFNIKTMYFKSREEAGVQSPSGKKKWGFKSIDGILRDEKYYGAVCIYKTYMSDAVIPKRIINDGDRELVWWLEHHEPIISKKNGSRQLPFYLAPSQQPGIMKKQKNTKKNASCTQLWYWGKMRLHSAACEKPYGTRLFNA